MDKELKTNILKGSAATSIGTITGMIFQFLTIMLVVRHVSKDDMGIYSLVMVVANMFTLLGGLGLELTMVKSVASTNLKENKEILIPILILRSIGLLLFGLIFILFGRFIIHYFDDRIYNYVFYIFVIFIFASFRDLFYNLMQGLNHFKQYSIVNVLSSFFRVIVVLIFIYLGKINLEILLIIEILSTAQPLIHQLLVIPFKDYLKVKPTLETFKRVIRFSTPLYFNNLFVFINSRMNIMIIGLFLSPASVASYAIALNVPIALKKIFSSFIIVYFPNLAKLFSAGNSLSAIALIKKSESIFSIVMTFLVLISFVFRNEITILLYSDKYLDSALTAALLIFNFQIGGMADLLGYSFTPAGHPTIPAKINLLASIISACTSLVLIPYFGFIGAAYSYIIVNIVSFAMFYFYLSKYKLKPDIKCIFQPIMLMAILALSYFLLDFENIFVQVLIIILYLVIGWFFIDEFKSFFTSIIFNYVKYIRRNSFKY